MDSNQISDSLDALYNSLETIHGESKFIYLYLTRLQYLSSSISEQLIANGNSYLSNECTCINRVKDFYNKFENDINVICSDYLKEISQIHIEDMKNVESLKRKNMGYKLVRASEQYMIHEEERLKLQREIYSRFCSSLDNVVNNYIRNVETIQSESEESYTKFKENINDVRNAIGKVIKVINKKEIIPKNKEPNFIYRDHHISNKLTLELISEYPNSYLYKEYVSDRRIDTGDIYIDRDSTNEDFIIEYMKNSNKFINHVIAMGLDERHKLLEDLEWFELPIKSMLFHLFCTNDDTKIIDAWNHRKMVMIDDKIFPFISEELKKNGRLNELYDQLLVKDIHYNKEERIFPIHISIRFADIIENYLCNKKWNNNMLLIERLYYNDILEEMTNQRININEENIHKLKKAWMSVRRVFINNNYIQSIDNYLHTSESFVSIYLHALDTEKRSGDGYLYVSILLKYGDLIDNYLSNNKKLNIELLKNLKNKTSTDFINEFKMLGLSLNTETINDIKSSLYNPLIIGMSHIVNDIELDQCFQEWLGTQYNWECIFRASEQGYSGEAFHKCCDNRSPTLIIIRSHNGWIFGGYTTQLWNGNRIQKLDDNAFIFTLSNPYGIHPTRYNSLKDNGRIWCWPNCGPIFCSESTCDLFIGRICNEQNSCYINNSKSGYEFHSQYKASLFVNTAGSNTANYFSISDYEVLSHSV